MSIVVEPSDVTNVAPELSGETPERIQFFIDYAQSFVNECKWGATKGKLGVTVMAAHLLTMSNREGKSGQITSEKVGDIQQNFGGAVSGGDAELGQTAYGTQFVMLRKTILTSPLIV